MSGEQLMAHLGLPLKHRLDKVREKKSCFSLVFIVTPPWRPRGMERKLISCAPPWCCEVFVQAQGSWKWKSFQGSSVLKYWNTPVLKVSQLFCGSRSDISNTPLTFLHGIFSFCSQFPWFTSHGLHSLHENKSNMSAFFFCFLFPLLVMYKETAKKKCQVRIYYFKIQFLTKAETHVSNADYLIPWNVLGNVL